MAVTSRDRQKMQAIARSLAAIETDIPASPVQLAAALIDAAAFRRKHQLPPLTEVENHPESEFYRRARALGIRRSRS
jgi:hypothetical protein